MRISDWSSDVCSSDLYGRIVEVIALGQGQTIVGKRQRLIFAEEFARGLGKDVFPVQITSRQDDIAPSVREVGPYSGADVEIRTVALVRNALLRVQFDTAEIFPELEIDHASQGIRPINGRSTARDTLCAGNQRCRDAVEIDRLEKVKRLHPFQYGR